MSLLDHWKPTCLALLAIFLLTLLAAMTDRVLRTTQEALALEAEAWCASQEAHCRNPENECAVAWRWVDNQNVAVDPPCVIFDQTYNPFP